MLKVLRRGACGRYDLLFGENASVLTRRAFRDLFRHVLQEFDFVLPARGGFLERKLCEQFIHFLVFVTGESVNLHARQSLTKTLQQCDKCTSDSRKVVEMIGGIEVFRARDAENLDSTYSPAWRVVESSRQL